MYRVRKLGFMGKQKFLTHTDKKLQAISRHKSRHILPREGGTTFSRRWRVRLASRYYRELLIFFELYL